MKFSGKWRKKAGPAIKRFGEEITASGERAGKRAEIRKGTSRAKENFAKLKRLGMQGREFVVKATGRSNETIGLNCRLLAKPTKVPGITLSGKVVGNFVVIGNGFIKRAVGKSREIVIYIDSWNPETVSFCEPMNCTHVGSVPVYKSEYRTTFSEFFDAVKPKQ